MTTDVEQLVMHDTILRACAASGQDPLFVPDPLGGNHVTIGQAMRRSSLADIRPLTEDESRVLSVSHMYDAETIYKAFSA